MYGLHVEPLYVLEYVSTKLNFIYFTYFLFSRLVDFCAFRNGNVKKFLRIKYDQELCFECINSTVKNYFNIQNPTCFINNAEISHDDLPDIIKQYIVYQIMIS